MVNPRSDSPAFVPGFDFPGDRFFIALTVNNPKEDLDADNID